MLVSGVPTCFVPFPAGLITCANTRAVSASGIICRLDNVADSAAPGVLI
ncbi:MAG TPA: hypothetical protein VFQ30_08705 [Ktedonobacteraceae bacterium]|nr:hypothetical protein [Ktedonobacteraceae bacterium]